MNTLAAWSAAEVRDRLASPHGLRLQTGPFSFAIRSPVREVADGLALHYRHHPVGEDPQASGFSDFHLAIGRPWGLRRFWRPQVEFRLDGQRPFEPLPGHQGYALLEWGLNWTISSHAHRFVILHAAVLARGDRALLMPAPSGSGKSTLCAALSLRGWRLLSDELALLDPVDGRLHGLARPVSLKNASIEAIRRFEPGAPIGPSVADTAKGRVAYLSPPADAVAQVRHPVRAAWVVLPRYQPGAPTEHRMLSRAEGFMELQRQTFNYDLHGLVAFKALGDAVAGCRVEALRYRDLDEAVAVCETLARPAGSA